jgi:hypothetical protein
VKRMRYSGSSLISNSRESAQPGPDGRPAMPS